MFSWMVPGLGMFNESYYIFSVGNVKPIWQEQYPECWKVILPHVSTMSSTAAYPYHTQQGPMPVHARDWEERKAPGATLFMLALADFLLIVTLLNLT